MADRPVYIKDPSQAPEGVTPQKGSRGGLFYIRKPVAGNKKLTTPVKKTPAPKGGGKAKKPPPPPKRGPGQKFQDENDPNLPGPVKLEGPDVRKAWVKAFNDTLAGGGSDADAMFAAKQVLPKRGPDGKVKPPKPDKREQGQPFSGADDANLPSNVKAEAPAVQAAYVRTFNATLAKGGSEADAAFAAKQELPKRTVTPPKPPKPKVEHRQVGQPFKGPDDPQLSMRIRQESDQTRQDWVTAFNGALQKIGNSEADAVAAANKVLPDRGPKKKTVVQSGRKIKEFRMDTLIPTLENEDSFELVGIGEKALAPDAPVRGMAALFPGPEMAKLLAANPDEFDDATRRGVVFTPPEMMHVTLAYYPSVMPEQVAGLIQHVAVCASNCWDDIETEIEGAAQFSSPAGESVPYVLLVDPSELMQLRNMLANNPLVSKEHGFIPHMTLAYVPDGDSLDFTLPPELPLTFDTLSLLIGDQRFDFKLGINQYAEASVASAYRSSSVDSVGDDTEDQPQPHFVVSQTTGEGMDDQATEKAGKRMAGGMRDRLASAVATIKDVFNWASYEDQEDSDDAEDLTMKAVQQVEEQQQFVVFKDATTGEDRWLSFSSNAFKDREEEIVTTKALEDVVAAADISGDRGVLRVWHIPGADIGVCDFQGVQGRVLVESGTFYDTPFAQAAKETLRTWDGEPLGISVGFRYPLHAFDGKTYSKVSSIFERSVLPNARAANPWTAFTTMKEDRVDPKKTEFLGVLVGQELAGTVLRQAEEATKSLEGSVAFKEAKELTLPELLIATKALVDESDDGMIKATFAAFAESTKAKTPPKPDDEEDDADSKNPFAKKEDGSEASTPAGGNAEILSAIGDLLKPIAEAVVANTKQITAQGDELKALKEAREADATKESNAPRGAQVYRATESSNNLLDGEKAKEALGLSTKEGDDPTQFVKAYIGDLIGTSGRSN